MLNKPTFILSICHVLLEKSHTVILFLNTVTLAVISEVLVLSELLTWISQVIDVTMCMTCTNAVVTLLIE